MLMLKLQYFDHLRQRADSLEKTLMLQKTEAGGEGGDRMRWLDGITIATTPLDIPLLSAHIRNQPAPTLGRKQENLLLVFAGALVKTCQNFLSGLLSISID